MILKTLFAVAILLSDATMCFGELRQLTDGPKNHLLTNINVWSHDSQWIYYDVRSDASGSQFDGDRIERVHVATGLVEVLYRSRHGAHVGVVTVCPHSDKIVFIHGPEVPTEDWNYAAHHRRGVVVSPTNSAPQSVSNLDARDLIAPFTPGALRGGSHVHVFSHDGLCASFTYEDHVLATQHGADSQRNQRNVGVSMASGQVLVPKAHPRNHDGEFFSVLVTRTTDEPELGSDQINRAYEDAWIGEQGYMKSDGQRQFRALAFIGDCVSNAGRPLPELFVVDLPDNLTIPGDGPLCGTPLTRPLPPRGTLQRRLTFTGQRKYPGLAGVRHWPRSSPDGSQIAFLMRDDTGVSQLWLISPLGGEPRQLTHGSQPIASAFSFRSDGRGVACVIGDAVCEVDTHSGAVTKLTSSLTSLRPEACVYSPDGSQVAFLRSLPVEGSPFNHIFVAKTRIE